jgi:hypothetical protein
MRNRSTRHLRPRPEGQRPDLRSDVPSSLLGTELCRELVCLLIGFAGLHVPRLSIRYPTCVSRSFFASKLPRLEATSSPTLAPNSVILCRRPVELLGPTKGETSSWPESDSRLDIYVSAASTTRAGRDFAGSIFFCRTAEACACGGDGISAAWRNLPRKVSDAIFAAAVKHGYLKSNPVRSVELPPEPAKLLPVLGSDEQLARLLDELPEPYRTMIWLVCISGVRIDELLAFRWRAADRDRNCFWVVEAVDREKFYSLKTHRSRRPILLEDEDMKRLIEFRRHAGRAGENDWLFLNRFGTGPIHANRGARNAPVRGKKSQHFLRHLASSSSLPRDRAA